MVLPNSKRVASGIIAVHHLHCRVYVTASLHKPVRYVSYVKRGISRCGHCSLSRKMTCSTRSDEYDDNEKRDRYKSFKNGANSKD